MPRKGTVLSETAKEKNRAAIKAWHDENTEKLCIRIRKEKARRYKELASRRGKSLAGMFQELFDAEGEREGIE